MQHRTALRGIAITAALACVAGAAAGVGSTAAALAARGEQLYDGRAPIDGRVRGHAQGLPAAALACANCHEPSRQSDGRIAATAPQLDRASLLEPRSRRGGPPSRYDEASFCRVLRDGIDPALVVVFKTMPTYTLADDDCAALWAFVSSRRPAKPSVTSRDVVTPDVVTPDVVTPEVVTPDMVTPNVVTPNVVTPNVVTPNVATPNVVTPTTKAAQR